MCSLKIRIEAKTSIVYPTDRDLSEWVAAMVETAVHETEMEELISTEELLGLIDIWNEKWKKDKFNS